MRENTSDHSLAIWNEADKKRQSLIKEIFSTEENYVENLKIVSEVIAHFFHRKVTLTALVKLLLKPGIYQTDQIFRIADEGRIVDTFYKLERTNLHKHQTDEIS